MSRSWHLAQVISKLIVSAEGHLALVLLDDRRFVLVCAWPRDEGATFLQSGVLRNRISSTALCPGIVVVLELLVGLNRCMSTPGPGTFRT